MDSASAAACAATGALVRLLQAAANLPASRHRLPAIQLLTCGSPGLSHFLHTQVKELKLKLDHTKTLKDQAAVSWQAADLAVAELALSCR